MDCDNEKPSILEEVIAHFSYLQGNWAIDDMTYRMLPLPMAKAWVWEEKLKKDYQLEVNQFTLVCYVLALRYFKNYEVEIKPIEDETILKMNQRAYASPKPTYTIYLNGEILAFQTGSGMFYTNSKLLERHKKTLGFYCENLKEAPFCLRLNSAEKHLFSIWLTHVRYLKKKSQETYIQIINRILIDLEPCKLRFDQMIQEHYFSNMLDHCFLPAGMDVAVCQYEKNYMLSDLILRDTSGLEEHQFIFLDKAVLNNYAENNSLTVLNHIRYFELINCYEKCDDILWCISHYYRQKVDCNIRFIYDTKHYFLGNIYRIEKSYISGSMVSDENLMIDKYLYLFPLQTSILDIYDFDKLNKFIKLVKDQDDIQLYFQWNMSKLQVVSNIVFQLKNQVIDILNTDIEVKLTPEYKIKNLEYYELRYKTTYNRYSLTPVKYDGERDNCYTSKYLMDLHGLYEWNHYCGIFKTYHIELENDNKDEKINVRLKFYYNGIIYSYDTGESEDKDLKNKHKKEMHSMCYKRNRKDMAGKIHPDMYQYIDLNTISYDDLELLYLNSKEGKDFITSYHWDFDGKLLFNLSEKDIRFLIWNIFIDLISQGYNRNNISWNIQYHNIKESVNNRIFEQLMKNMIADISMLKKVDDERKTEEDQYDAMAYMTYNIHLDMTEKLRKKLTDNADCDPEEVQMVYMSDQAIFEDSNTDLSIQAKYREKYPEGLLSALKLLVGGRSDILELYGLEYFTEEFHKLDDERFRGLVIHKMENISFRLDNPWYNKATQELIYMMTCIVLNAVIQIYDASKLKKQIRHMIISFDEDSILYQMLKRMPCFESWQYQFGKMVISKIDLDSIFIGADFQENTYRQIKRNEPEVHAAQIDNGEFMPDKKEMMLWEADTLFQDKMNQIITWGKLDKSQAEIRRHFINNPAYIRNHISQIKNQIIKEFFDIELRSNDIGLRYRFLGSKELLFYKSGPIEKIDKKIEDKFEIINLGNSQGKNKIYGIMILPAVLEKEAVIERGVIIIMDKSAFTMLPSIGEKDFESLSNENAKTAANVTQHMLKMIEQAYEYHNIENQKMIDQLKGELSQSNQVADDLQKNLEDTKSQVKELEENEMKLEAECASIKNMNMDKDAKISYLTKIEYRNIVISDYNRYLSSPLRKDSFFNKYKMKRVTAEINAGQIRFRKSIFQNDNTFIMIEAAPDSYMIFPDKKRLVYTDYKNLLLRLYKIQSANTYSEQLYKIIAASIVDKHGSYFTLSSNGVMEINK